MKKQNQFPQTLIQIHYHDRPCGVMKVIRYYAEAFDAIRGKAAHGNFLICAEDAGEGYPEFKGGRILDLPIAGYREYKSRREFLDDRKKIVAAIASLLLSDRVRLPVAIIAHNLTLCKNAALVSAFAELARGFSLLCNDYRFFSVAHDFASEGRVGRIREILTLEKKGIAITDDIAAASAPVRFIAVHERARKMLEQTGVNVSLLVSPVTNAPHPGKLARSQKKRFLAKLAEYVHVNGLAFRPGLPVFACPVRTIGRKNVFEAIAVACILRGANLLLGSPGSSAEDRKRHANIITLAKEHGLPVVTDIQTVVQQFSMMRGRDPVPLIYSGADAVITCSVTEGFGYLLHEPWVYGVPVCGRRPAGFCTFSESATSRLYTMLPVPAGWVDAKSVLAKYCAIAARCFTEKNRIKRFVGEAEKRLGRKYVDFGSLDAESQIALIKKLASSERLRTSWRSLLEKPMDGWPGMPVFAKSFSRSEIIENTSAIIKKFSRKKFQGAFRKCMGTVPAGLPAAVDWGYIEKEYGEVTGFRP